MSHGVALRQAVTGWEFVSEAALETFVWENLFALFQLQPLKRQYFTTTGEVCDLLAVDKNRGLVILELKNTEDRYLVQQLTRYYASLLDEQPFSSDIDYTCPLQLVAIAPTFHRHNFIDRQFHRLNFKLLQFSIQPEGQGFAFVLQDVDTGATQRYPLPHRAVAVPTNETIPAPPALLLNWLGGCTEAEQTGFLRVRQKLLECHSRMQEAVDKKSIHYGAGKSKPCAEILFQQKTQKPVLFLRLPTPSSVCRVVYREGTNEVIDVLKPTLGRLRLWTDGQTLTHVGHVSEGFGTMRTMAEWEQLPKEKRPACLRQGLSRKSHVPVSVAAYLRIPESAKSFLGLAVEANDTRDEWEGLATLAVKHWLERLG